jgi:DNA-binding XRE family transcriptional regulator
LGTWRGGTVETSTLEERLEREYSEKKQEEIEQEATARAAIARLSKLRKEQGLTQIEMADLMGTSQSHLSRIENSEDVYLSTLKRYAEAIGAKLEISFQIKEKDDKKHA